MPRKNPPDWQVPLFGVLLVAGALIAIYIVIAILLFVLDFVGVLADNE